MFSPRLACSNTRTLDLLREATCLMCFRVENPGKKTSSLTPAMSPLFSLCMGTSHSALWTCSNQLQMQLFFQLGHCTMHSH